MDHLKELGTNLKAARKRAGLEQSQVAARLGVHEVTVSNWERGAKEPDEETIRQLAALYKLPPSIVRYGEDGALTRFVARLQEFLAMEAPTAQGQGRPARARGGLAEPGSPAVRGRRA